MPAVLKELLYDWLEEREGCVDYFSYERLDIDFGLKRLLDKKEITREQLTIVKLFAAGYLAKEIALKFDDAEYLLRDAVLKLENEINYTDDSFINLLTNRPEYSKMSHVIKEKLYDYGVKFN